MLRTTRKPVTSQQPRLFSKSHTHPSQPTRSAVTLSFTPPPTRDPICKKQLIRDKMNINVAPADLEILLKSLTNAKISCNPGSRQNTFVLNFGALTPNLNSSLSSSFAAHLSTTFRSLGIKNTCDNEKSQVVLEGELPEIMLEINKNFSTLQNTLTYGHRSLGLRR